MTRNVGLRALACVTLLCAMTLWPGGVVAQMRPSPGSRLIALPDLTVTARTQPPYLLANPCAAGEAAITFRLKVTNAGAGSSGALSDLHAVAVQDAANAAWSNGAALPALAPSKSSAVDVTLVGLSDVNQMAGHHLFIVTVNAARAIGEASYANNTITVPVDFPAAFCQPPVARAPASQVTHTPPPGPSARDIAPRFLESGLPAPQNLTNTVTQGVCAAHGGSAAALACTVALPAGKLILVWDYPFNNAIDGFRIYGVGTASPRTVHNLGGNASVVTQADPSVRLAVLDPPAPNTCFAVTAFKGSDESEKSPTQYCVAPGEGAKTITFKADAVGAMVADFFVRTDQSVVDNDYANRNPFIRDLPTLTVGYSHSASLFHDRAHTQVAEYVNSLFRGFAHFTTPGLSTHHIVRAALNLDGAPSGTLCVAKAAAADHYWRHGDQLHTSGAPIGSGPYQGPKAQLEVTKIVQAWADNPASNNGIALDGEQPLVIYNMVSLTTNCVTTFSSPTLDVTYY